MGDKTGIEWTDATWNPVTGCTKVSQGCKHCYAERVFPRAYPGRQFTSVVTHPERLDQPMRWRRPRRIFVNSMSDLFHEDVPFDFIDRVFAVMSVTGGHTFQVLTKRPERMREYMNSDRLDEINAHAGVLQHWDAMQQQDWPLPNVWLGVSVEDQATADERIPVLLKTPAAVRWISAEPLLGRVDLCETFGMWWNQTMGCWESTSSSPINSGVFGGYGRGLDWVVAGGESGPKARPSHPDWFRSLRDQCVAAGVPFLFKQWGEWFPGEIDFDGARNVACPDVDHDPTADNWQFGRAAFDESLGPGMVRVGKRRAGRTLDGQVWDQYPEVR